MASKGVVGNDIFVYEKLEILSDSFNRGGRLFQEEKQCNGRLKYFHVP